MKKSVGEAQAACNIEENKAVSCIRKKDSFYVKIKEGKNEEKISAGKVVKAMILNCLGLVSSPLYIFKDFFEGKAAEHLLGQEIKAEYLNDDRLGRVLDKMYEVGLNQIFPLVAIEIIKKYKLKLDAVHLDSREVRVHGEYNNSGENKTIEITHGYSRDKRPDLKPLGN